MVGIFVACSSYPDIIGVLIMLFTRIFNMNFIAQDEFEWLYIVPLTFITFLSFVWLLQSIWLVSHQNSRLGLTSEFQHMQWEYQSHGK